MDKEKWLSLTRRFFHCLRFFHQSITATEDSRVVWLGCSCGRSFYGVKPGWYERARRDIDDAFDARAKQERAI